ERAEQAQREAVATLIGGNVGGPWGILGSTRQLVEELRPRRYQLNLREHRSSLKAGDVLDLQVEPITDPVTGAEAHPGAVLPEGLTIKEGSFASSKRFRLANGVSYDHSGRYAAFGPFDYNGP